MKSLTANPANPGYDPSRQAWRSECRQHRDHSNCHHQGSQPTTRSLRRITYVPMMSWREAISIITVMIGTEITPLTTALQYKALMGSMALNPRPVPTNVETTMTA